MWPGGSLSPQARGPNPIGKGIGLSGAQVQRAYEDMGVIASQDMEPAELFENDERLAADLEAQIAAMS